MRTRVFGPASFVIALLTITSLVLAACGPAATPVPPTQAPAPTVAPTKPPEPTKAPEPTKPPTPVPPTATPAPKTLLDIIKARGVMKVSTDPNYKPQSFINETTKELDGFDIDVAKEVAKRLGVKVEFITPSWDIIVAANWGGRWDVSIGSMTITPDRAKVLFFSSPYYYTPAQFGVHKNSAIAKVEDFAGKTVCVGAGTTYESYLAGELTLEGEKILKQVTGAKAQPLETDSECIQAIQAGRKEFAGVLTALPTLEDAIKNGAPLKMVGDPVYYEDLAAAFDRNVPNSEPFVEAVTKIIDDMRKDGTLTKLAVKWYGVDLSTKKQ